MVDNEADDSIRGILEGAVAGTVTVGEPLPTVDLDSGGDAPPIEAPAGETEQQKADRLRDEAGRFAKNPKPARETLALKPAKPAVAAATLDPTKPAALAPEIDKDGKHLERIPAPATWKGLAKVEFDRMPRAVREEVARHEAAREAATAEFTPLKEMYDANRDFLVNEAGSVVEATRQLMAFARMSVENPAQLIHTIARAKGVDLVALVNGQRQAPPQQQQANDPQAFIAQEVQRHVQPLLAHIQQTNQQQTQATVAEVKAFAADPAHPFFNDVADDIRFLLESNRIPEGPPLQRLQQAYEQATWMNPTIRTHLQTVPSGAEATRKAAEVANAKRALGTSLTGSPVAGAVALNGQSAPNASIRDDLMLALRQQQGTV